MRCFVAIELPEDIRAELFHNSELVQTSGVVVGNFVEKNNLHLTLKFLADLSSEEVEQVEKKLGEIKFQKFRAGIGKPGFFPADHIRVFWFELVSEKIRELFKIVDEKLTGFGESDKEFSPHVTLARIKEVKNKERLLEKVNSLKVKTKDFEINSFSLIKSELKKEGPIYRTIKKFNLN